MMKQISIIRHNIGEHNGCLGEMMQLLHGLWAKSSQQDRLEPRISALERELGSIGKSLREMNASLRVLSNGQIPDTTPAAAPVNASALVSRDSCAASAH